MLKQFKVAFELAHFLDLIYLQALNRFTQLSDI